LGFDTFGISAEHSDGLYEAMDAVLETCPDREDLPEESGEDELTNKKLPPLRIAVVGKPNVGKSSLINRIIGKKRMMVSEVAGTTRDTIDSEVNIDGREYLLVDTAGIRKKAKVSDRVEIFSVIKAIKSLEKADLALLVISAIDGISMQEAKIAGEISKAGIACIIVVNKWDAVEKTDKSTLEFSEKIEQQLKFLSFAPIIFVSALNGQRVLKIFDVVEKVKEQYERRIETGRLNQIVHDITKRKNPPVYRNKRIKFYYVTQTGVRPPAFVFMTNYPEGVDFSYKRYLINRLKESTGIDMAPVHLIFKRPADRRSRDGKKKSRATG
jgi:GTP-binding protein